MEIVARDSRRHAGRLTAQLSSALGASLDMRPMLLPASLAHSLTHEIRGGRLLARGPLYFGNTTTTAAGERSILPPSALIERMLGLCAAATAPDFSLVRSSHANPAGLHDGKMLYARPSRPPSAAPGPGPMPEPAFDPTVIKGFQVMAPSPSLMVHGCECMWTPIHSTSAHSLW